MEGKVLNPHEASELHELIRSETICAKKMRANVGLVKDPDLRFFIQDAIDAKRASLDHYQEFYEQITQQ